MYHVSYSENVIFAVRLTDKERWAQSSETIIFNLMIFPRKSASDSTNFFSSHTPCLQLLTRTDAHTRDRSPFLPIERLQGRFDSWLFNIWNRYDHRRWPNAPFGMTQKYFSCILVQGKGWPHSGRHERSPCCREKRFTLTNTKTRKEQIQDAWIVWSWTNYN